MLFVNICILYMYVPDFCCNNVPIYQHTTGVTVKLTSEVPVWKRKLKLFQTKIQRQLITLYRTGQEISFKYHISPYCVLFIQCFVRVLNKFNFISTGIIHFVILGIHYLYKMINCNFLFII